MKQHFKPICENIFKNYLCLPLTNLIFYFIMQKLRGCFVTTAINTTGNVVLKEKVVFVFKYFYNYITENSSMRGFCNFFFTIFFLCVLKVKAFLIKIALCKLYKPFQKYLFLEGDKCFFNSPLQF